MSAHDDDMITRRDDDASDSLVPTWTSDGHLDDSTIHAWLDGAFDEPSTAAVVAHADGCAACQASVAEARGFIAGASRVVRALDAVPSGVVPLADVARTASRIVAAATVADATRTHSAVVRSRRVWYTQPIMRAAAAVLLMVAGVTYVLPFGDDVAVPSRADSVGRTMDSSVAQDPQHMVSGAAAAAAPTATARLPMPATVTATAQSPAKAEADAPVADRARSAASGVRQDNERRALSRPRAAGAGSSVGFADRMIIGRVTATGGQPVTSASVSIEGSSVARTSTDSLGKFVLRAPADSSTLLVRRLGFAPARVSINARGTDTVRADAVLKESVNQLSAVTVSAERARREDAAIVSCWAVDAEGSGSPVVLPTHISAPSFVGATRLVTQWTDWPIRGRTTNVEVTVDSLGRVRGFASQNDLRLTLVLASRAEGWVGTATQQQGRESSTRAISLTLANPSMCKP